MMINEEKFNRIKKLLAGSGRESYYQQWQDYACTDLEHVFFCKNDHIITFINCDKVPLEIREDICGLSPEVPKDKLLSLQSWKQKAFDFKGIGFPIDCPRMFCVETINDPLVFIDELGVKVKAEYIAALRLAFGEDLLFCSTESKRNLTFTCPNTGAFGVVMGIKMDNLEKNLIMDI